MKLLLDTHVALWAIGKPPIRCVGMGGRYTLYDPATKTAYQLDDAKKAATFAGAKVSVTGTLNATTKTIHVASIKAGA